ncbi:SHOCT domain-containing protein [Serinicoccus profundi]|uniref:SHOCT domain-containing protein n=1 Tax=Serinicoccus profundi TaxID=1078471 RepID=UPI001146849D|nr:SHOCT domain-containing protein [Serinicoccus profundi]
MVTNSGSPEFDALRQAFVNDPMLRTELEWAYGLAVENYNPSDRGLRFITGGIGEWIITLAAYRANLVTLPDGHNADGHDTASVLSDTKGLWSVKTSYSRIGKFTITNGQGGPGAGLVTPTVFLSPNLPGITYIHPEHHREVRDLVEWRKDSTALAKSVVAAFASQHPECLIPFAMPDNPGAAVKDPSLEAVRIIVDNSNFPRLRAMFTDVAAAASEDKSVVAEIQKAKKLREDGVITKEQFEALVNKLTGLGS